MSRKLALKRLTASDLTLFKWHFQNRHSGNQKAFNLDSRLLVGSLYPQLGEASEVPNPRYPIDLYLFGPGLAPVHNLQRKILRQQKNWRLNGEMIDDPEDSPARYNVLSEGDFALFEFSGSVIPSTAKVVLIAAKEPDDAAVYAELAQRYSGGSMWPIRESDISVILNTARPSERHPLYDWVESDALEDAALGGAEAAVRLGTRRAGRGVSPEDFVRARQLAEQTGVSGEELLNEYFEQELAAGRIRSFEWTASVNAVSPFDFSIISISGERRLADAKSTTGGFSNAIHLSWNEVITAVEGAAPYDLFRLYNVTKEAAELRVARNVGFSLRTAYEKLKDLPSGFVADSIAVNPNLLPFDEEVLLVRLPGVRDVE